MELLKKEVQLSKLFRDIQGNRASLCITDWGVTETTLEEVFLKVTAPKDEDGQMTRAVTMSSHNNSDVGG